MIAQLTGIIAEKNIENSVVLEVNGGVGYEVFVASEEWGRLVVGDLSKFHIYEHIREQSHDLFGFTATDTKQLFKQLIDVNGVGPKMALNILNTGTSAAVRQAIAGGDLKQIQKATGVGKRVAERVVMELKDKVGLPGVDLGESGLLRAQQLAPHDEAAEALVALGYNADDATHALANVDANLPTEERIRQALKGKL
jgi:holliday junction DNA helicase RuvA